MWNKAGLLAGLSCGLAVPAVGQQVVAHWSFEEGTPGAVASGAESILDTSGNGHHGTPFGNPIYTPASAAGGAVALQLDGQNDQVVIPDDPDFYPIDGITLEAYVKYDGFEPSPSNNNQVLFRGDNRGAQDSWSMYIDDADRLSFRMDTASDQYIVHSSATIPKGTWLHIACTWNNSDDSMRVFINGVQSGVQFYSFTPMTVLTGNNPGVSIGNLQETNWNQHFRGAVDELRVSDWARTPGEFLPPPTCLGDWNDDGLINTADFVAYLGDYSALRLGLPPTFGSPDIAEPIGILNTADFVEFLNAWADQCP